MMDKLSRDTARKYALLNALTNLDQPSKKDLSEHTGIPDTSIVRLLKSIKKEYKLEIKYIQQSGCGFYLISNWGIIEQDVFKRKFGEINKEYLKKLPTGLISNE
ncbi:MarR family transcriptional regulator [Yersinia ruckeri]|nr:MarR family transcriptional regulator [Yersinia ruckeri]